MKIDGSRRAHHAHHAHQRQQQPEVSSVNQTAGSLFNQDSFEGATAPQQNNPLGQLANNPQVQSAVQQIVDAFKQLFAMLKSIFSGQNGQTPADGTTPVSGTTPANGTTPTDGTTPVDGSTPATAEQQYRALIAADIKASRGTEATQADYDYWLPKLMGPNDSGFVTSGQMTATEYWHRRMLGWQAGGSDVAQFGPYAGDGNQHGDVPSAASIVPGIPDGNAVGGVGGTSGLNPDGLNLDMVHRLIEADVRLARGSDPTQEDYDYWTRLLMGPNDSSLVTSGQLSATEYWHRRMLGWQAGGSDAARYGPYAGDGQEHGAVPSYAQMLASNP
jgi:hypothetical protein